MRLSLATLLFAHAFALLPPPPPSSIDVVTLAPPPPGDFSMVYFGEYPVLSTPARVHIVWYGDWKTYVAPREATRDMVSHFSRSQYWRILTDQYDGPPGTFVTRDISMGQEIEMDSCSAYEADNWGAGGLVLDAIARGRLPLDASAIYAVISSPDVISGDYHGGLGYGTSSIISVSTWADDKKRVSVQSFIDTFLHEAAESAVNNAWKTRVQNDMNGVPGQWEVADVCDGFRKRQADGSYFGGPTRVYFGSVAYLVSNWLFDLRTRDCAVFATGSDGGPYSDTAPSTQPLLLNASVEKPALPLLDCSYPSTQDEDPLTLVPGIVTGLFFGIVALAFRLYVLANSV